MEQQGAHEAGGASYGVPTLVTASLLYKYPNIPKTLGESTKYSSSRRRVQNHQIPSWGLFRSSAGGGIDHGGLLHQHHSPSDEV